MSNEDDKPCKKPFKGAQVLWPADMPDDMLEDAIAISKKAFEENEFEKNQFILRKRKMCAFYVDLALLANKVLSRTISHLIYVYTTQRLCITENNFFACENTHHHMNHSRYEN